MGTSGDFEGTLSESAIVAVRCRLHQLSMLVRLQVCVRRKDPVFTAAAAPSGSPPLLRSPNRCLTSVSST